MKKLYYLITFMLSSIILYGNIYATGGGIYSIDGFSQTSPTQNLDGSNTTFTTSVKDIGSKMSYDSASKKLFTVFENSNIGKLYVYNLGSTGSVEKTLFTSTSNLRSIGMHYNKVSGYTTLIGLTQGNGILYTFPVDGGSFSSNDGDIVILKINSSGDLVDYSYIQKKSGTSILNPNFHDAGTNKYLYIGGSLDGKGILIEIESSTGDISKIVQFSTTTNIFGAIPISDTNVAVVTQTLTNTVIKNWNTTTNIFETDELILTGIDSVSDMVWINSGLGYFLIRYSGGSATIGAVTLNNATNGTNSVIIGVNLSNMTPTINLNMGETSANNVDFKRIIPSSTGEQFLYLIGSYTGNGFDGTVTDTASTTGKDGVILEIDYSLGLSVTNYFVSHLTSGDNEFTYSSVGDNGTFFTLDSNGYMYSFGDSSNANGNCPAGTEPVPVPYKINTSNGIISNYGDLTTIQNYLSATTNVTIKGNDSNSSTEVERITGEYNNLISQPSYIFNYGFLYSKTGDNYWDGFAKQTNELFAGWNSKSIQEIKNYIITTFQSGTQGDKDSLATYLIDNLKTNASLSSTLGNNLGSYGYFFQSKGVDYSVIDGTNPFYYVDIYNPDVSDRAKLNSKVFASYYLSARGVNNSKWHKDPDTKNASAGTSILPNDIVWSPLDRGGIYASDSEFPQLMFPIKDKTTNSIVGYVEFACGNLVCKDYTKECIAPSTTLVEANKCGNGTLDSGEECEKTGQIFPAGLTTNYPWYTYSCSDACKVNATPTPSLETNNSEKIVYITRCKGGTCGNGIIDAGEECEIGVVTGGVLGTTSNCNQYSCKNQTISVCSAIGGTVRFDLGQECSPNPLDPYYDVNCSNGSDGYVACTLKHTSSCGDGIIDRFTTDRISETCDFGENNQLNDTWNGVDENNTSKTIGGVQCSNTCQTIIPDIPEKQKCGNEILEPTNGEQCENKTNGTTEWDQKLIDEATASGFIDPVAAGWLCSNTCKAYHPDVCGDGMLGISEECDGGAGCYASGSIIGGNDMSCKLMTCGNGIIEAGIGEQCDGDVGCNNSCRWDNSGTGTINIECKEDVAFEKSYNFLTFDSKSFNGVYDIWSWNGNKFTKQTINFPSNTNVLQHTTENVMATLGLKTYMTNDFVNKVVDNKLLVPLDRVFNVKNRYLDKLGLQSVFMDANKVIKGGYVRTGFGFLTDFYKEGVKMEVEGLKCNSTDVSKQAVTNIIGIIDTNTMGIYLIKEWGSSLPEYTEYWKDRSIGQTSQ